LIIIAQIACQVAYAADFGEGNISITLSKKYNTTSFTSIATTPIIVSKEDDLLDIINDKIAVENVIQNGTSYLDIESNLFKHPQVSAARLDEIVSSRWNYFITVVREGRSRLLPLQVTVPHISSHAIPLLFSSSLLFSAHRLCTARMKSLRSKLESSRKEMLPAVTAVTAYSAVTVPMNTPAAAGAAGGGKRGIGLGLGDTFLCCG